MASNKPATAAVMYTPDAFRTDRQDLKGRHMAGAGMLGGLARHLTGDDLYVFASSREAAQEFARLVQARGPRPRGIRWISNQHPERLAEPGALLVSDPGLARLAWTRRFDDQRAYSLTGVIHTICSSGAMDLIGDLLLAPLQRWDALICTSRPARTVIGKLLDEWADYLGDRCGGRPEPALQLPVIPLGVDADFYGASSETDRLRTGLRARLGIGADEVAILFLGRLTFHAKAHPVPLLLAAEAVAAQTADRLHLIFCGRFANTAVDAAYREAAVLFAPSVAVHFVDGANDQDTRAAWFAADIFTSPSDNIQETFGLTPIEAMAAGLPVVVSDWDGYRDTVVDGETGFRIPTRMLQPRDGEALMRQYQLGATTYDRYIGAVSQLTAVDIPDYAAALAALVRDPSLRQRMGAAGRRRVRSHYDWGVVVSAYEELWAELRQQRRDAPETAARRTGRSAHPLRQDPFALFAPFASGRLDETTRLAASPAASDGLSTILRASMNRFAEPELGLDAERYGSTLFALQGAPPNTIKHILERFPAQERAWRLRALGWLVKMGLLRQDSSSPGRDDCSS